ncbi:NAD(P)/FAD-dependent oxidoreductase [Ahrensia marina]|uniref:Membrane protein n=1 Tax=Ahrensia marina TaxID=1514904 RepID=A0A0M9GNV7_9HYPH|nr:NAD(P)/FAD-dependent oxidoreductase [Ahrensia marina]KPB02193.1 membrane protein [Ahrensia marina]
MRNITNYDVLILGGGAAGLMCAIEAGKRGRRVLVIDHAKKPAEKIRISGGGRCNFTNLHCGPGNFLSQNPHFCKSALSNYTSADFIELVRRHQIPFHEKTLGQLFCDTSAKDIIKMLLVEMAAVKAELWLETNISQVTKIDDGFRVETSKGSLEAQSVVVATGGKSIPKMGATGFGYDIAAQFGLAVIEPRPALVPFTYTSDIAETWGQMSGVAMDVRTSIAKTRFEEAMLITHRGLSGPAILQISSYWREGNAVEINMAPNHEIGIELAGARHERPKATVATVLSDFLPKRFAQHIAEHLNISELKLADMSKKTIQLCEDYIHKHSFMPGGTEGYRTAEVTLGGVSTSELSQKTMEAKSVPGLFFIGEVVDVTGHLGGHNFQWAWSSGVAAGQAV